MQIPSRRRGSGLSRSRACRAVNHRGHDLRRFRFLLQENRDDILELMDATSLHRLGPGWGVVFSAVSRLLSCAIAPDHDIVMI